MSEERKLSWTDVHVHLQDKRFGDNLDLVFDRARKNNVDRFVCSATGPADWTSVQKIGADNENVLVTYGIHPWFVNGISGDWENWLRLLLQEAFPFKIRSESQEKSLLPVNPKTDSDEKIFRYLPGVGEIGLDFAIREKNADVQEDYFRRQLALANEKKVPVVLHSVHAVDRVLEILADYRDIPLYLFHGFVGTEEQIRQTVDLGAFFSFSRRNTLPQNVKSLETIEKVPRDRILLESDGPTLVSGNTMSKHSAPPVLIQQRSSDGFLLDEPARIRETLDELAGIRNMAPEKLALQLMINEKRFFMNWPRA